MIGADESNKLWWPLYMIFTFNFVVAQCIGLKLKHFAELYPIRLVHEFLDAIQR